MTSGSACGKRLSATPSRQTYDLAEIQRPNSARRTRKSAAPPSGIFAKFTRVSRRYPPLNRASVEHRLIRNAVFVLGDRNEKDRHRTEFLMLQTVEALRQHAR